MTPKIDLHLLDREYTDAVQKFLMSLTPKQTILMKEMHQLEKTYTEEIAKEQNETNTK